METLLQRIYAGQKYPHVYTLSISTGKNQSAEASGALYIPTHEYSYKVFTGSDKYYKNITSPTRRNCENTRMYKYEQYKWRLRVITGKL